MNYDERTRILEIDVMFQESPDKPMFSRKAQIYAPHPFSIFEPSDADRIDGVNCRIYTSIGCFPVAETYAEMSALIKFIGLNCDKGTKLVQKAQEETIKHLKQANGEE